MRTWTRLGAVSTWRGRVRFGRCRDLEEPSVTDPSAYVFEGGYPTSDTIRQAFDDADLNRAVSAYRFFYPTVSIMATWKGNLDAGMVPNKVFGILEGTPQQLVFTPNSDTPYTGLVLELSDGCRYQVLTSPVVILGSRRRRLRQMPFGYDSLALRIAGDGFHTPGSAGIAGVGAVA